MPTDFAAGIIHHPTVFPLGPLELTGFGLAVLAAFWIAQYVCQQELSARGFQMESDAMPDVTMAALLGTLIGAKTYYVILNGGDPRLIFSRAGFVFWGGFMGGVLLCFLTIRYKKLNFARYADVAGIGLAAGYAVGRSGCWAVGDDYGKPWSGPLATSFPEGAPPSTVSVMSSQFGVQFPEGTPPDQVVAVHPTQLYETAMGMIMFFILWRFRRHTNREGWLFGMYCILAGIERFIVEFFRAKDDRLLAGGLSTAQFIAIATAIVGAGVMAVRTGSQEPRAKS